MKTKNLVITFFLSLLITGVVYADNGRTFINATTCKVGVDGKHYTVPGIPIYAMQNKKDKDGNCTRLYSGWGLGTGESGTLPATSSCGMTPTSNTVFVLSTSMNPNDYYSATTFDGNITGKYIVQKGSDTALGGKITLMDKNPCNS